MHAAVLGLPYFHLGSIDVGLPIQSFGVIVAAGVLIGAALLRRYAEWHGVDDEHIRGLTGWITVTGFIGAHLFDVIAYQWHDLEKDPKLILELWKGISSYGGFLGGAAGFAFYVWWKRLPARLMSDIAIVGLLPAFSIGRIGCTVVSDHIGAAVDAAKWYSALAMDYPRDLNMEAVQNLVAAHPGTGPMTAWNLGLIEFMYLVPVNAIVLLLAFRSKKRLAAGFIPVLTGILYAPVRFFLDFLRPEESDPRYLGMTFAQWASIGFFAVSVYVAMRVLQNGKPADVVTPTSGEAQRRLKLILQEDDKKKDGDKKDAEKKKEDKKEPLPAAKAAKAKKRSSDDDKEDKDDDETKDDDDEKK
jgi:phosphatidylglycerol:prolipoprotein diacylglycerol transferase